MAGIISLKSLYGSTIINLTRDKYRWTSYLDTASRLYKYDFRDTVLIYAQRPDATACASFDLWNRLGRHIRKGAKGIAIAAWNQGGTIRYVFDVSDTVGEAKTRPRLWKLDGGNREAVRQWLLQSWPGQEKDDQIELETLLSRIVDLRVRELYDGYYKELSLNGESLIESLPEDEMSQGFLDTLRESVQYCVYSRCGLQKYAEGSFTWLPYFNDERTTVVLGTAANEITNDILAGIEREIKQTQKERREEHERNRNHVQAGRGRAAAQSGDIGSGAQRQPDQIRAAAKTIPEGTIPGPVQLSMYDGGIDEALPGYSGTGHGDEGHPDGAAAPSIQTAGEDGLPGERVVQQPDQRHGGRDRDTGDRVREVEPPIINKVAAEAEVKPSAFSLELNEIDAELLRGSGVHAGKYRIYEFYATPRDTKDAVGFLKKEYGIGGHSHTYLNGRRGFVDHDAKGLRFRDHGFENEITVSWAKVHRRLKELIGQNRYLSDDELARLQEDRLEAGEHPASSLSTETTNLTSPGNYRITDDNLGVGGGKTKYKRNVDAIRLLKEIEGECRQATREEQETLAQYAGWGGIPQAFDEGHSQWSGEYAELNDLLTEPEYAAARASTLNAHYTTPMVIRAMYAALENMGFKGGNILEPACGSGNFFGVLPDSMAGSRLYGVELDSITGRIAQQLYPEADIQVRGFEETAFDDNFFDVAIGNVPFGSYKVADKRYDKYNLLIHDYFIAKTLDKVRPGGIVAFITSKGTLDKANPDVRKYIAQRAELQGAIRLPNNAFRANAGTEVTTDILFLKKREQPVAELPEWVYVEQTEDGIPLNHYYLEHPEMMLGKMSFDDSMYGNGRDTTLLTIDGADLAEQLGAAARNIHGEIGEHVAELETDIVEKQDWLPADPAVRNYSYAEVDGKLYFRENSRMDRTKLEGTVRERVMGLIRLRDCTRELIDAQMDGLPDETVHDLQSRLNSLYDAYTRQYGIMNSRGNRLAFEQDASYPLLCSLEILDEERKTAEKAEIFTQRTIRSYRLITHTDTAMEALMVSLSERARVDIGFMAYLSGKEPDEIISELKGVIYKNPLSSPDRYAGWETADGYLSGNVREKLEAARSAAAEHSEYQENVDALLTVQPEDLEAVDIDVRLGSTWLEPEDIRAFWIELIEPPSYLQRYIQIQYSRYTGNWAIEGKGMVHNNIRATEVYGTRRKTAFEIIEDSLNLRTSQVYDTVRDADGKERRVLNQAETIAVQQKQTVIHDAFRDWIWEDTERRERLVRKYNDLFNNIRPRSYDGSHIRFVGMNPEIALREHQRNAVARILYGGNTLLAHEVGGGKTFTMVAAAQEAKRIGLTQKTLIAVPNHLTGQWAGEYLRLYPGANILVATERDFETHRRKTFCARIATGEFDAVIMGHSQLLKIPMSIEWQKAFIQEQVDDLMEGIAEAKAEHQENWTIKQMERTRKSLALKLERLNDTTRKDNVIDFEQLGIDRLMVDESDEFKNLLVQTKMRNVAGIGQAESQKASDLYMKGKYIDKITDGRGQTFATGTPISNTLSEMYTLQRYLQYGELRKRGLEHFDSWVSVFADTRTVLELAPSGKGYRTKTRLATFHNLPELTAMFAEFADVQTAEMLKLPVPRIKGGKVETIALKPSELQERLVDGLVELTEQIRAGLIDPREANMLSVTGDGRKLALDQRLIDPLLPDDSGSKTNACAERVHRIWLEKIEKRLTQMLFCDLSTPRGEEEYSVYQDMKAKLMKMGIPEREIVFVHDAKTDVQKEILFGKVRSGSIRILMGSTAKMGAGTNVQRLLYALHDLDVPWRPRDLTQRHGRILRQGNENEEVEIYRYVTEGTFDSYNYQILENKQRFISQIMTNKPPARRMDDIDNDTLTYAEVKAIASGNPKIKEKMDLDLEIARLQLLKNQHGTQQYRLQNAVNHDLPFQIKSAENLLCKLNTDKATYAGHENKEFSISLVGQTFTEKAAAGDGLKELAKKSNVPDRIVPVGQYRGFELGMKFDTFDKKHFVVIKGALDHTVEMGESSAGLIQRMDNALNSLDEKICNTEEKIRQCQKELADAVAEKEKPFLYEKELKDKLEQVAAINIELSLDKPDKPVVLDEKELKEKVTEPRQKEAGWER
jgi:N12 class adenine-specific DNA methylase